MKELKFDISAINQKSGNGIKKKKSADKIAVFLQSWISWLLQCEDVFKLNFHSLPIKHSLANDYTLLWANLLSGIWYLCLARLFHTSVDVTSQFGLVQAATHT